MCALVSSAWFSASAQRSASLLAYIDILDSSLATIPIGIKPKEKCREYKWGPFFSTQSRTWLSWRTREQRCHDMHSLRDMAVSDRAGEAQWEEKLKIRGNSDFSIVVAWGFVHFFVRTILSGFWGLVYLYAKWWCITCLRSLRFIVRLGLCTQRCVQEDFHLTACSSEVFLRHCLGRSEGRSHW